MCGSGVSHISEFTNLHKLHHVKFHPDSAYFDIKEVHM